VLDAGPDAVVYTAGGGTPIGGLVDGETYYAIVDSIGANSTVLRLAATRCGAVTKSADDNCTNTSVQPIDLTSTGSGKSHSLTVSGGTPSADAGAYGPRTIVLGSGAFRGVAVTASNSDDVAAVGISAGIAGTVAVNLAGSIDVTTVHTSAHIGGSAKVNCGTTCATNVTGANSAQSVRVAASNQYYELGLAGTLAVGGTVGVAVPVGVRVVDLTTNACMDSVFGSTGQRCLAGSYVVGVGEACVEFDCWVIRSVPDIDGHDVRAEVLAVAARWVRFDDSQSCAVR
jgi:hypothetical protein